MKVLTATFLAWLLRKFGGLVFSTGARIESWRWSIQDWAGIAPEVDNSDRSRFGCKVGGTD